MYFQSYKMEPSVPSFLNFKSNGNIKKKQTTMSGTSLAVNILIFVE